MERHGACVCVCARLYDPSQSVVNDVRTAVISYQHTQEPARLGPS